jgi:uncharacterized membrane protein YraQ (UPF0718 family)
MFNEILQIMNFIINAFGHIWPYLLITIPLAVAIQMSGASKHINRVFQNRPIVAIFLATIVGAFSPLCSCSVIPVIATLLIGGVPLGPVMAFWIASPSMDPEIFFLSVATIGWELAVWRIIATLTLSLSAGFITHFLVEQGWLGQQILRSQPTSSTLSSWELLKRGWQVLKRSWAVSPILGFTAGGAALAPAPAGCATAAGASSCQSSTSTSSCGEGGCGSTQDTGATGSSCGLTPPSFRQRLLKETWNASLMVAKFMLLAFFLEALIILYVPTELIAGLMGQQNTWAILSAALIGIPVYTSSMAALPMVGGLLTQGMSPAAALAFLIAGPTTTLPAMAAVWGLTTRRVFALYVSFSLVGAMVFGYLYALLDRLP